MMSQNSHSQSDTQTSKMCQVISNSDIKSPEQQCQPLSLHHYHCAATHCYCQHEYVIHLGFTSLVQLRDRLFQSFVGNSNSKFDLDLIPLIFKYKGSRAIRFKI